MFKTKNVILVLVIILIGASMTVAAIKVASQEGLNCPEGYTVEQLLEPIREGETGSRVLSQECVPSNREGGMTLLEPLDPNAPAPLPEWTNQGEDVNGIVEGPSKATNYRCVTLLDPIKEGEDGSKVLGEVCSEGDITEINGYSLQSNYLVAKFYNYTNYGGFEQEYYGSIPCSPGVSYGVNQLPSTLDNKYESGKAYSSCDQIEVFDFANHEGATYACGASCSSFYALNNNVTSWRVKD